MPDRTIRILAVDDEPEICDLTKAFLEISGDIEVRPCGSVREALTLLSNSGFDAVVSDYQMPEADGISFLKSLRGMGDETPFILFTGKGREDVVIEALNSGADFYLQKGGSAKPLYAELEHKVRAAVEKRRQNVELHETRNRFRMVLEKLPIGLWMADREGKLILGNPAGQKIWGGDPKVGQEEYGVFKAWRLPERKFIEADDWALGYAVNEGRETDWELLEIEAFDGTHKIIYNWASPIRNDKDEIVGAFVINQEITKEVEMLNALDTSEKKYRSYIERSPFGLFIADIDGRFLDVNDAACRITGYSREEILGMSVLDLHDERTSPAARAHFEHVITAGSASAVIGFVHKCGEVRYWSVDAVTIAPDRFMAFVQDVTEGRVMETSLLIKERAVDGASSGIALFTLDNRFSYANRRALEILGTSGPADVAGRTSVDFHSEHKPPVEILEKVMRGETWLGEVPLTRMDGRQIIVDMSVQLVSGKDGTPLAIMSSINDITERKMMEQAIRSANHKLNLLSSLTRHELRNQMMVLMGSLSLAKEKCDPEFNINRAMDSATRIGSIIEFSKDYEDMGIAAPRWHRLSELVTNVFSKYRNGVALTADIPDSLEVYADDLIRKVFVNLVDNSLMHGEHVTRIGCWTMFADEELRIFVSDDGVGIPANEKERIFERGYGKNTGQGLFLAREILDLTGMSMDEVGEEGKGAAFRIRVPRGSYRTSDP